MPIDAEDLDALLPELDDAPGPGLAGGATYDGLRFAGLDLQGDAAGARFLECELADCDLDGVAFDRARLSTCRLADVRATTASFVDATLLDVVLTGGRLGALTAHGAELTRVGLEGVKVDYLDLRGADVTRLDGVDGLAGCTISREQLTGWAEGIAAQLGIRVG